MVVEDSHSRIAMFPHDLLNEDLKRRGWASVSLAHENEPSLSQAMAQIGLCLGTVISRSGDLPVERVSPRGADDARKSSLSRRFGTGRLPLHCDMAHWIVPCRYIVLACADTGRVDSPTTLLDTAKVKFSESERLLMRSACFAVRNGQRSFYATLIDRLRPFVRVDPGCMEPLCEDGVAAMNLFGYERHRGDTVMFRWKVGDILIIDNWRVLHGRGNRAEADPSRRLLRAYVQ